MTFRVRNKYEALSLFGEKRFSSRYGAVLYQSMTEISVTYSKIIDLTQLSAYKERRIPL